MAATPQRLLGARTTAARAYPIIALIALNALIGLATPASHAQESPQREVPAATVDLVQPEAAVDVDEVIPDEQIRERLERIYAATGWYEALEVSVQQGVVFLNGVCATDEQCDWATNLARRTQGVVGVANQMEFDTQVDWDVTPAWQTLEDLARDVIRRAPLLLLGLLVLVMTVVFAWMTRRIAGNVLARHFDNRILNQVATTVAVLPVVLIGLYLFLQVAGLSRLAATVLGGTGLIGLIVGIAFRDIAENFLASVLISIKRPFRVGHLIRIDSDEGYVQSVTTRGTLLMTADGNHIHVPNARLYKSTLYNFSANPRTRYHFPVGIDYADSTAQAQEVCVKVLHEHPTVLADPEPFVLVESLGASSVQLKVYFWVHTREHNGQKVRSSVIRRVKAAIEEAGLTMPDDAREVIFPRPVPIRMESADATAAPARDEAQQPQPAAADSQTATAAEGDLGSESETIRRQAEHSEDLDLGPDILGSEPADDGAAPDARK